MHVPTRLGPDATNTTQSDECSVNGNENNNTT